MGGKKQEPNDGSTQKDPDRFWVILGIVIIVIFVISLAYQSFFAPARFNTLPVNINRDAAYQKYEEGIFILDVRDYEEWDSLAFLAVLAMIYEEYDITISRKEFDQVYTLEERFNLIKKLQLEV